MMENSTHMAHLIMIIMMIKWSWSTQHTDEETRVMPSNHNIVNKQREKTALHKDYSIACYRSIIIIIIINTCYWNWILIFSISASDHSDDEGNIIENDNFLSTEENFHIFKWNFIKTKQKSNHFLQNGYQVQMINKMLLLSRLSILL